MVEEATAEHVLLVIGSTGVELTLDKAIDLGAIVLREEVAAEQVALVIQGPRLKLALDEAVDLRACVLLEEVVAEHVSLIWNVVELALHAIIVEHG